MWEGQVGKKIIIAVVDGLGGGIGCELIAKLKTLDAVKNGSAEVLALATNSVAAERMVQAGAAHGASGENAILVSTAQANIICGPIGIIIGNSMYGEITLKMSQAILASRATRILIPLANKHLLLAGLEQLPLSKMLDKTVLLIEKELASESAE
jgi:hypothetical protein